VPSQGVQRTLQGPGLALGAKLVLVGYEVLDAHLGAVGDLLQRNPRLPMELGTTGEEQQQGRQKSYLAQRLNVLPPKV
jgi:hypothetical protein